MGFELFRGSAAKEHAYSRARFMRVFQEKNGLLPYTHPYTDSRPIVLSPYASSFPRQMIIIPNRIECQETAEMEALLDSPVLSIRFAEHTEGGAANIVEFKIFFTAHNSVRSIEQAVVTLTSQDDPYELQNWRQYYIPFEKFTSVDDPRQKAKIFERSTKLLNSIKPPTTNRF